MNNPTVYPVVAIVGRPNVGKSSLFNAFLKKHEALVSDEPGATRDRHYGYIDHDDRRFIAVDTGGIGEEEASVDELISHQAWEAIEQADLVLWVVDAKAGLTVTDEAVAQQLRQAGKTILGVVNKVDGLDEHVALADFYPLGLADLRPVAATHRRGIKVLLNHMVQYLPYQQDAVDAEDDDSQAINVAVIGRPNAGKSTLINRLLGEERVIVYDQPGTTRDSLFLPFERRGQPYVLIDTAGVRRRNKVKAGVERLSVVKTLQAIAASHVVVYVIDGSVNVTEQDLKLIGQVLRAGKALVIAVNKWDHMTYEQRQWVKKELHRRLSFVSYAHQHFISALHGTGVGELYPYIDKAYHSAVIDLSTSKTTKLLEQAVQANQPPISQGRRIKLRYAHMGGKNPPRIIIHGKKVDSLSRTYKRYLENFFRKQLGLVGTPIELHFKQDDNPYQT